MHLTKNDMIDWAREGFEDHGYKSAINKRLCFGFNITPLTYADCISLNKVVKELDNQMLDEVEFYPSMFIDSFDLCISRLLYVAGRWIELCLYNMLIMNDIKNEIVTINYSTVLTTITYVYFRYGNKIVNMCVDDEKIGIKIETNTIQEKEFHLITQINKL